MHDNVCDLIGRREIRSVAFALHSYHGGVASVDLFTPESKIVVEHS
jgi:hypothetical protein